MKHLITAIISTLTASSLLLSAAAEENTENLVPLDAIKVKNAGIVTESPKLTNFETTLFTIGRIEAIPANRVVISSRISGRVVTAPPIVGDIVEKGQTVLKVESRQPGSPPPVIPVTSPAGGIVFESHVSLGEPVDPSQELMDVIDISQVWAVANIPESKASQVKIGQKAHIRIISLGDKVFTGELIRFGTEVDKEANTVKAIFLIDNPDQEIRPNMLTEFNIVTKSREKVLSIPKSAIQGDTLNAHIFKKDYSIKNAFRRIPVVVGEVNHDRAEIIVQDKELNVIDDVVTQGGYFLSHTSSDPGDLVKALDDAHGHKHNPDGSEMSADQKAASGETGGSEEKKASSTEVTLLYAGNIILLCMLVFTLFRKKDIN